MTDPMDLDAPFSDIKTFLRTQLREIATVNVDAQTVVDMLDLKLISLVDHRSEHQQMLPTSTLTPPEELDSTRSTLPLKGLTDEQVRQAMETATEKLSVGNISIQTKEEAKALLPVLKLLVGILEKAIEGSEPAAV